MNPSLRNLRGFLHAGLVAAGAALLPSPLVAEPPESPPLLESLSEAQIAQSIALLRSNYVNPQAFTDAEMQRAQLAGLLSRLGAGAGLLRESQPESRNPARPFLAEILDTRLLYLRPGEITPASIAASRTALDDAARKNIHTLVLDLRSTFTPAGFEDAAAFAEMFCPKGALLFRVDKPGAKQQRIVTSTSDSAFTGRILIVTNSGTSGAAEAVTAALQTCAGAVVVGTRGAGRAAEFVDYPIGAGLLLRTAVAETVRADGTRLFPTGIPADFIVESTADFEVRADRQAERGGVASVVFDKERPRLNEAALIADANPEIDGTPSREKPAPIIDPALQKAVDLAIALEFFKKNP